MKKILPIILIMLCVVSVFSVNASDKEISVYTDYKIMSLDTAPIMTDNRVMLPMRNIFENLGAEVIWEEERQSVVAITDSVFMIMQIGDKNLLVVDLETKNAKNYILDVAPQIINSKTMVPVRAVAEGLGYNVTWDEERYRVMISRNPLTYYPESPLLPTYGSLGNYVSTLSRDENEVLYLENGNKAYVMGTFTPNETAVGYMEILINEFGWEKIFSKTENNTVYSVLKKDDFLVGMTVFYSGDSLDYLRIYPKVDEEDMENEPVFYEEYPDLPMFSVIMSLQCRYVFETPDNCIGYIYDADYIRDYQKALDVYGWKQTNHIVGNDGYAYTYEKDGTKICVAFTYEGTYVFGYNEKMDSDEAVKAVIDYGKKQWENSKINE